MHMRDRRVFAAAAREQQGLDVASTGRTPGTEMVSMPPESERALKHREKRKIVVERRRGILTYSVFLAIFFVVPLIVVLRSTPFFTLENLKCRASDRLFSDSVIGSMEKGYADFFNAPPLFASEEYNRTMFWGTYEPSRIFAMKSRADKPLMVGLAWYDVDRTHSLRHLMPFMHNKVNSPRNPEKRGVDPEVMSVRWIKHDGIHYGRQAIEDRGNGLSMEVEFLKSPSGDTWHVRLHCRNESPRPIELVLYVANSAAEETALQVGSPEAVHNDGDWSPVVAGSFVNSKGALEGFRLTTYDDHNPLFDTAPWKVFGLSVNADEAFALKSSDTVGGTPLERAAAGGRGIAMGHAAEQLRRQHLDLRDLPSTAFSFIQEKDPQSFRLPSENGVQHNVIVMKKSYDGDFRLELSFLPDTVPAAASDARLTTCQLTNGFRRREKAIKEHTRKIVRRWVRSGVSNTSNSLFEQIGVYTLAETLGSMSVSSGQYLRSVDSVDAAWDAQGKAVAVSDRDVVPAQHAVQQVTSLVGSRTDEAFGQQWLTGLPLLVLTRWNKEVAKDVLASWFLGAQDPVSGFIPARSAFTAYTRSLVPASLRVEHISFATPPTLLVGLQELLHEIERRPERLRKANKKKVRNTPAYTELEAEADVEFLRQLLPSLKRWRAWWHVTQCGGATDAHSRNCSTNRTPLEQWPVMPTENPSTWLTYRWRSRNGSRLPSSGMDDYPRDVCPGEHRMEAHVDLFAWIALLSQLISRIELRHLGLTESVQVNWEAHLNRMHWDEENQRYADRSGCVETRFSPYVGYANIYPVLLGVVQRDISKVKATLSLASKELMTPYGLMSVSYESVRHARTNGVEHDNLWMGYIWPSTNMLLLHSLKSLYLTKAELLDDSLKAAMEAFYVQVRRAVVEVVRRGGRWWEYYSPVDGSGEGSKTYIGTQAILLTALDEFA